MLCKCAQFLHPGMLQGRCMVYQRDYCTLPWYRWAGSCQRSLAKC